MADRFYSHPRIAVKTFAMVGLATIFTLGGCAETQPTSQGQPLSKWIEALNVEDPAAHGKVVDEIVSMGDAAQPLLLRSLDDSRSRILEGVAASLLRIDPKASLREVTSRLENGSAEVRVSMATALIRANVEPHRAVAALSATLGHEDERVRNFSIKAFGEFGPQSHEAVPALAAKMRDDADPGMRWRCAYALARIGPGARLAVAPLVEALKDTDSRVREGAAFALGAVGEASPETAGALKIAMRDKDAKVRMRAIKALRRLQS